MRLQFISCLLLPITFSIAEQIPMSSPQTSSQRASLADLLTIQPAASIFYSYARELHTSSLFGDKTANLTLLVPTNKAVMALARKPHQGPTSVDSDIQISEQEFDERSRQNVERWVSAHIIPDGIDNIEPGTYPTMLDGKSVTFARVSGGADSPSWVKVVLEDGIRINDKQTASNGFVYMIDGTILVDE